MKQQMISKFMQKDFESKLKVEDVPDADVEKYYDEHPDEFHQKDEVRVSQILVKDKAKADTCLRRGARAAQGAGHADQKGFRDLVAKYSEDEDSKQRGGDLSFFDKDSATVPKPIVEAAFKLKEVGDVARPIKTDKGWAIIRLTQKRPGFTRPLAEVKRQIQQRLFRDLRTKSMDTFVDDLKKKSSITINDDKLAKVVIETGPGSRPPGMDIPGAPISPIGGPPPGTPAPRPVGMQPSGAPAAPTHP